MGVSVYFTIMNYDLAYNFANTNEPFTIAEIDITIVYRSTLYRVKTVFRFRAYCCACEIQRDHFRSFTVTFL